jgi:hypothetical protein
VARTSCWALGDGVGCAAGSPPGPALKRALGPPLAACFAPPRLVHLPPTSPPPPPRKGRGRDPRAADHPLNTSRGADEVLKPHIREGTAKRKKFFLGVGCSILGVGCLRIWALGVLPPILGVGCSILGVGCLRIWALGVLPPILGVGCSILGVGCLRIWALGVLPPILGVGCVGCLWRGRWVFSEGPERRQRGGSTSTAPAPQPGRQQGPLDLERSTVGVQVTWDPEVCGRFVGIGSHFHQQPTPKKGRRR